MMAHFLATECRLVDTFRKWHDAELESAMQSITEVKRKSTYSQAASGSTLANRALAVDQCRSFSP